MERRAVSAGKLVAFGGLTWLIPFLASIPLIGHDGQPRMPIGIFKSTMIVLGSAVGASCLVRAFRPRPAFRYPGLVVGGLWLGINVVLDLLILVPLTKMPMSAYAGEIALRYLTIPIMALAIDMATTPLPGQR